VKKRWAAIKAQIKQQLLQGVSPDRLAAAVAMGVTLASFPLIGFTTLICVIVGYSLGLNQPLMQAANYLAAPLQLALIPVFLRMGEWIFSQPKLPFSPSTMVKEFLASPAHFFSQYGKAGALAACAWLLTAPLLFVLLFFPCRWWFRAINHALARRREKN